MRYRITDIRKSTNEGRLKVTTKWMKAQRILSGDKIIEAATREKMLVYPLVIHLTFTGHEALGFLDSYKELEGTIEMEVQEQEGV